MIKRLRSLSIYFPSILSRYSIQLLVIALPWMLQAKGLEMEMISMAIGAFFVGSLGAGSFWFLKVKRANLDQVLRLSIVVQAILSFACLMVDSIFLLVVIRFLQGLAIGVLRPCNQMWLLEFSRERPAELAAQRATYSQFFIAIGMSIASLLGSYVIWFAELREVYAISYYALICFAPVILILLQLPRLEHSSKKNQNEDQQCFRSAWLWLKENTHSQEAYFHYVLSLVIFKVWILAFPFLKRESSEGMMMTAGFLSILLSIQPLVFSGAQVLIGKFKPRIPKNPIIIGRFLLLSNLLQAGLTLSAVYVSNIWLSAALLLAGGSLAASIVYPLSALQIMRDLEAQTQGTRRQAMLLMSLSADVGQVIAGLLLSFQLFASSPMSPMFLIAGTTLVGSLFYTHYRKRSRSSFTALEEKSA